MSQRGWAVTGKILLALLVLALAAAALAVASAIRGGLSARVAPTTTEEVLARSLRHIAVPLSARSLRNPVPFTAESLADGRAHFADHCATCHANDGSGKNDMGAAFYPKVPDMRRRETQELSDGELFYIIKDGVRLSGMPAWGGEHDDADNWKLVLFIRHLPKITPAEIEEMQRLNPKTFEERDEEKFLEGH